MKHYQVYRTPVEEIMTLTEEQIEASTEVWTHHRTLTAVFTTTGLEVPPAAA